MSIEDTDKEQNKLVSKLRGMNRDKIPAEKRIFLKNLGLFLSAREKIRNNFKSEIFPTEIPTPESTSDPKT